VGSWNSDFLHAGTGVRQPGFRARLGKQPFGISLFVLGMLIALPSLCQAQVFEFGVTGGHTTLKNLDLGVVDSGTLKEANDDIQLIGDKYYKGARFTANLWNYYGVEAEYIRTSALLKTRYYVDPGDGTPILLYPGEDKINVNEVSVNFVSYFMPRTRRWRPFATIGLGRTTFGQPKIPYWTRGSATNYGFNWGGGLKVTPFKHAVIRLDVRQYMNGKPWDPIYNSSDRSAGGSMRHWEVGLGVSTTF
jgi:hypothetical protein